MPPSLPISSTSKTVQHSEHSPHSRAEVPVPTLALERSTFSFHSDALKLDFRPQRSLSRMSISLGIGEQAPLPATFCWVSASKLPCQPTRGYAALRLHVLQTTWSVERIAGSHQQR